MSQQSESSRQQHALIAPAIKIGKNYGYEVTYNYDLGAGVVFDALSLGLTPSQDRSSIIVPSQERVPSGG